MVSAIDCTCAELTGSGNVATAASIAVFMRSMVSGGNDALEKSSTARTSPFCLTRFPGRRAILKFGFLTPSRELISVRELSYSHDRVSRKKKGSVGSFVQVAQE